MTSEQFASEEARRGIGLPIGTRHYRAYVGAPQFYDEHAALQFKVITDLGLREEHHVLDIGCGSLRLGRLLIPYLLPDRYVGVEPEEWLIRDGIRYELGEGILAVKRPLFCCDASCDFGHFGRNFNYVMMQSVVTHAPLHWVERAARDLSGVVSAAHGRIIGTYLDGVQDYQGSNWAYPDCIPYRRETLQTVFASAGFRWVALDHYTHPAGMRWFALDRSESA